MSQEFEQSTQSTKFEHRVHELLDDRKSPEEDAELRSEAATCSDNQCLLAGQRLMLDGLELLDIPDLSSDFAEQTVAQALAGEDHPSPAHSRADDRFKRRSLFYVAALIAVVALLLAQPIVTFIQPTPDTIGQQAEPDAPPKVEPEADQHRSEEESSNSTQFAQNGVSNESETREDSPPIEERDLEDLVAAFKDFRERIPATSGEEDLIALVVEDVATGLRPVADSVGGALNVLRSKLPPTPKAENAEDPQAWLRIHNAATLT